MFLLISGHRRLTDFGGKRLRGSGVAWMKVDDGLKRDFLPSLLKDSLKESWQHLR